MITSDQTDIELYTPIETIVAQYEEERDLIEKARITVGAVNASTRINIRFDIGGYHRDAMDPLVALKQQVWKDIIEKSNCQRFMSTKAQKDLNKVLYEKPKKLPDISIEGLRGWLSGLMMATPEMIQEACREAFEILTPQKHVWGKDYKTNEKCREIPKSGKVILEWACDTSRWNTTPQLNHDLGPQRLRVLDKVFAMLDGKPTPDRPNDSYSKCRQATQAKENIAETEYFKLKMHMNGNLHLTIKRDDLVKKLVELAVGATLGEKAA